MITGETRGRLAVVGVGERIRAEPEAIGAGMVTLGMAQVVTVSILLSSVFCFQSHAQWVQTNPRFTETVAFGNGPYLFAATDIGVFRSTDEGSSWTQVTDGAERMVHTFTFSGSYVFAGCASLFLSTNGGKDWTWAYSGLPASDVRALVISDTTLFAGTDSGIYRSTNNGASWTPANIGLTTSYVQALTISGTNLFAGTADHGVFLSTNGGANWTGANEPVDILALAVNGSRLFAGTYGQGVLLSTDNGSTWTARNDGLFIDNAFIFTLAFSSSNLFAGFGGLGVYLSTNNGSTWTSVNTGMPGDNVYSLAAGGKYLIAGTSGGIWRRPLTEMGTLVQLTEGDMPREFLLLQNYPNPFNPSTTIRYGLPSRSHVTLTVFNTLGQQVASLVNETLDAGYHEARLDGSRLASGVYFYRLEAGTVLQTKKLLLLR